MLQLTESLIKGAIPVLSHKSAAVCLVLNCLCPGLGAATRATCRRNQTTCPGTLVSGLLVLACCSCSSPATLGCPRWHAHADTFDR